ncbi:hypothetical protein DDB_G0282159 [Dictyostelium discoideum AX4]|uniref:Major facilitator superfamily (MFS) profile domain-containing protein n=1 Tax=Dictyostelium discoideum TaxID=44689 RepID=Q54SX3_DICDI|nr:hypothetical protein DDB_G0282159 [Dictyostelium discoideum AX4]EAL66359.1 hypothetical protein DDB_G0282159 [Dictyostelium discoideum AX4]|eukprot:XP_640336.1 hypothetical protein DDB_G0282159 [Dictyostelium discoideum AX4]
MSGNSGIPLDTTKEYVDTTTLLRNKQNLKQYSFNIGNSGGSPNLTEKYNENTKLLNNNKNNNNGKYKLSFSEKFSYGIGEGGLSVFQMIKGFFLNSFLLNVAQIDSMFTAVILFTAKFVDAFSDVLVGNLSDKTKSRWGRRRVWILFGSLPFAILYCGLWWVPPNLTDVERLIYYQFVVIGLSIAYTCVAIPYSAMNAEITDDYDERTTLAGIRMISLMIGGLTSTFTHSLIIKIFTTQTANGSEYIDYRKGYLLSGGIWGGVMIIPLFITFFGTRKIPIESQTESHIPFFKGLGVMFSNRAFVTVTLLYFFCQIAVQFVQNNLLLYCTYVADAEKEFPYILATLQISVSIFIFVWGKISTYIGKKVTYYIGGVFLLLSFLSLFFLPYGSKYLLWGVAAFGGIGVAVAFLIPMSMLPDVVELDELKTGERREGLFYSLFLFFQKLGLSVGLAVSSFVLGLVGYEAPTQIDSSQGISAEIIDNNIENDNVIFALRILTGLAPAVIVLFSFVAIFFYPISKQSHNEIRELLKRKREGTVTITVDEK